MKGNIVGCNFLIKYNNKEILREMNFLKRN